MVKKSLDSTEKPRRSAQFKRHSKRVFVGIIGACIVLIGIVLIPYPGPGWLIVFSGLAVLSTEFAFAARTLEWLKGKYELWVEWLKRQNRIVQMLVLLATGAMVVLTLWLLNAYGILNDWFHLGWDWVKSPLFN